MADKTPEKETKETKKPAGLLGLVVPLIIVMVLMPTVAYRTTDLCLAKTLAKEIAKNLDGVEFIEPPEDEEEDDDEDDDEEEKKKKKVSDFLVSSQLVNIKNTNGGRSLVVSYVIAGKKQGKKPGLGYEIEKDIKKQANIREAAASIIGQFELSEMDSDTTKPAVKAQMIMAFENILGKDTVENVFFQGWTVQ
mgnify:CR=1 FL=1